MRSRLLSIATVIALLPLAAPLARADITLDNQTTIKLTFTVTPYIPPGQEGMGVICGQYEVFAGTSENLPANSSCGQRATIGANSTPDVAGRSTSCRAEDLSWTDGRLTVTGDARAIACAK